ncbi:hypothetical protein OHC33_001577 [Knufia fluminis]|uniref:Uncharacterized protein n=1 Tax=Knufia fluminis TaxID=191047 RepID=A0AAN8FEY6_9EURO|nr:hypothetical protein OHC33_001577 [Knufia fluminis]
MWASKHAPEAAGDGQAINIILTGNKCQQSVSRAAFAEICPTLKDHVHMNPETNEASVAIPGISQKALDLIATFVDTRIYGSISETDKGSSDREMVALCVTHLEVYLAAGLVPLPSLRSPALDTFTWNLAQLIEIGTLPQVVARIVEKVSLTTPTNDEIKERILKDAVARQEQVQKNGFLVKVLEQKYTWMWRLTVNSEMEAPETNGHDTNGRAAEQEAPLCKAREVEVELAQKLGDARKAAAETTEQLEDARKRNLLLGQNCDTATAAMKLAQEDAAKAKSELARVKVQVEDSRKENQTLAGLQAENMALKSVAQENTSSAANRRSVMLQKELESLKTQHKKELKAVKARTLELKHAPQDKQDHLNAQFEVVDKLEKRMEKQAERDMEKLKADHVAEVESLQGRLDDLQQKYEALEAAKVTEASQRQDVIQNLDDQIGDLQGDLDAKESALQECQANTQTLYSQINDLSKQLKQCKIDNHKLTSGAKSTNYAKDAAESALEHARQDYKQLNDDYANIYHEYECVKDEHDKVKTIIDSLKALKNLV